MGDRILLKPSYTIKVIANKTGKWIHIPKDIERVLGVEKGDLFELRVDVATKTITMRLQKPKELRVE